MGNQLPKLLVIAVLAGGVGLFGMRFVQKDDRASAHVDVSVPAALSPVAQAGQKAFNAVCAECHGQNASGSDKGPPLVHDIYNPGHHADGAFYMAAKRGVRAHHWPFGDMPPQPAVNEEQIGQIVAFVRELQQANGIQFRKHTM